VSASDSELDRIDPETTKVTMSTGFGLEIVRLETRQFFRLLRVLTHGAGPAMMQSGLNFSDGAEQFAQNLIMLVVMSIPDAEQEAIGFLQSMCQPAGLKAVQGKKANKQDTEHDEALWADFNREMFNPAPADTLDIIERIVQREAGELQELGKKLKNLFDLFRKTGQAGGEKEPDPSPQELSSQERSPQSSTSSAPSTGGRTTRSSRSRSAASASV
jgi:hypothetical protein